MPMIFARHYDGSLKYIKWFKPHNNPGDWDLDLCLGDHEAEVLMDSELPS